MIFKPISWGRRVGGLALAGASPGGAVLHTGAVGRKTKRPLFILFYSLNIEGLRNSPLPVLRKKMDSSPIT